MKRKELLASLLLEEKSFYIQTEEMMWKVLCYTFTDSLSLQLTVEVNAAIYVAKLHIECDRGN